MLDRYYKAIWAADDNAKFVIPNNIRFFYLNLDFLAILLSKLSLKIVTKFEYRLLNI